MSFLLTRKLEHERQCEAAIRAGRYDLAFYHAAKTAEFGYCLAQQTTGKIAARYLEDAEGWWGIVEKVRDRARRQSAQSPHRDTEIRDTDHPADTDSSWLLTERPDVTFDMIAGMAEAKKALRDLIVHPVQHPEKARLLKLPFSGGILLYGPPGNGKTTLAKAVAHEIAAPFFYASGAQIRSKWHGESEKRLRAMIQQAKQEPVAILFFDDIDSLFPRRNSQSSVVDNRIVTQFLAEIGGFEESRNILVVLGATNCPWQIDDAVFRTGRFDEKLYIPPPDAEARASILRRQLDGVPVEPGLDPEELAGKLEGYTGSDLVALCNAAKRAALSRSVESDQPIKVTAADLALALGTIPPSVSSQLLRIFETFRS